MVECLQAKLGIDARAHRLGTTDQETHPAGTDIAEQALLGFGFLEVLHIGDLRRRHTEAD
ncbi:Uncharacterised protein [Mycobacterium tuberculosis]|nr:Uncharacterised protein [Mycobacterium tuberculosis]